MGVLGGLSKELQPAKQITLLMLLPNSAEVRCESSVKVHLL